MVKKKFIAWDASDLGTVLSESIYFPASLVSTSALPQLLAAISHAVESSPL
jgi:hypothetical protein